MSTALEAAREERVKSRSVLLLQRVLPLEEFIIVPLPGLVGIMLVNGRLVPGLVGIMLLNGLLVPGLVGFCLKEL
eukprot:6136686-Prymnesium_polylepis.1